MLELASLISHHARYRPDATAVVFEGERLAQIREQLPPHVLLIDGRDGGFGDYRALAAAQPETLVPADVSADELFNIMFTSGTTGLPKGIMHPHFVRAMYCTLMAAAFRVTPQSRILHTGAIVFNGAFVTLMPAFYLGATYILHRQFDPQEAIGTIERERVTHVVLVPAQIVALLNSPDFKPERLASLECILSLGAPLLQRHKDQLNAALPGRFYFSAHCRWQDAQTRDA